MSYSEPIGDQWRYDPEYNRVAEFLGLDRFKREDFDIAKKIATIRDYLDLDGKITRVDQVLTKLDSIRKKMGTNEKGESLVNDMFQKVRLDMDRRRMESVLPKVQKTPEKKVEKNVDRKIDTKETPLNIKEVVTQTIEGVIQGIARQSLPKDASPQPQIVKEAI